MSQSEKCRKIPLAWFLDFWLVVVVVAAGVVVDVWASSVVVKQL
jgi:hypothetical protein